MRTQESDRSFKARIVHALERQVDVIPVDRLRVRTDETPEEVAARFVLSQRAKNEWDDAVGPFLDTASVMSCLGHSSRQSVSNAIARGDILALPVGRRMLYPTFQFSGSGQPLPRLRDLLPILREQMASPWTQALWLNTRAPALGDRTPAAMLHRGTVDQVLRLARADVERRAT